MTHREAVRALLIYAIIVGLCGIIAGNMAATKPKEPPRVPAHIWPGLG